MWDQGFFILRDVLEERSDEKFYEGIKTHIYNRERLDYDLLNIQQKLGDKINDKDATKQLEEYYNDLLIQGKFSGETKWKKCDLDIVKKLISSNEWQPYKEIKPEFFSTVKGFFVKKEQADKKLPPSTTARLSLSS